MAPNFLAISEVESEEPSLHTMIVSAISFNFTIIPAPNKIGRIIDIQIHPSDGKLFFLSENALWLMEKN